MGNSKRIILNTGVMYGKMVFSIVISLYTSRIVLDALGVVDYGVYNVVGGVVTMFAFLNATMASATQRFITFEVGKKVDSNVRKVFSASVYVHLLMALMLLFIIEVAGNWFIDKFIVVPPERFETAKFVFHTSVLTLVFNILLSPYRALINAHEKMIYIALIDSANVILKLLAAIYLLFTSVDKLKIYGINIALIGFLTLTSYIIVSKIKYKESSLIKVTDRNLYKELLSFGGFNLISSMAYMAKNQGFTVLLNLFFGPIMNAAFGVANQVSIQLRNFTGNIATAVNPQLVIRFAGNKHEQMLDLMNKTCKIIYFMMFIFAVPLLFDTELILDFWLVDVPNHAVLMCRLLIIAALIDIISQPIVTIIFATAKIKTYQMTIGLITGLNLPISYLFLKNGANFTIVFIVNIIMMFSALVTHIWFALIIVRLDIKKFLKLVIQPIIFVTSIILSFNYLISYFYDENSLNGLFIRTLISIPFSLGIMYTLGLNITEKIIIIKAIRGFKKASN